jgi:hypothetical protein
MHLFLQMHQLVISMDPSPRSCDRGIYISLNGKLSSTLVFWPLPVNKMPFYKRTKDKHEEISISSDTASSHEIWYTYIKGRTGNSVNLARPIKTWSSRGKAESRSSAQLENQEDPGAPWVRRIRSFTKTKFVRVKSESRDIHCSDWRVYQTCQIDKALGSIDVCLYHISEDLTGG